MNNGENDKFSVLLKRLKKDFSKAIEKVSRDVGVVCELSNKEQN